MRMLISLRMLRGFECLIHHDSLPNLAGVSFALVDEKVDQFLIILTLKNTVLCGFVKKKMNTIYMYKIQRNETKFIGDLLVINLRR